MEKVPAAEEILRNKYKLEGVRGTLHISQVAMFMREFAKLHVEAALKKASEKAEVIPIDHEEISEGSFRPIWGVGDDSILNAYPLDLIK